MKLREIYQLAVTKGLEADPRGREAVEKELVRNKKNLESLKEDEKSEFDLESLTNPYSDTRILYGSGDREVNTVLSGIDIEVGEILLADRLREKGKNIDLIISHHPEGKALAALSQVMHLQEDLLRDLGVPINVAEGIMAGRISEVERGLLPVNHNRAVDVARLLDIALMCVHTPADNLVTSFLTEYLANQEIETVGDVVKSLKKLPEYHHAVTVNAGPKIVVGSEKRRAGKIFVDMTGGTGGSEDAYEKLAQAGVGTIVTMHIGEKHRKEAEKNHINVVIAGHMASDSLGMNLFLDELAKLGIEIIVCSGLHRVERK